MPRPTSSKGLDRIFDANINRAKEGLRVCEEITRFILNNRALTAELKHIRHKIDSLILSLPGSILKFMQERDSAKDVGRGILANELKRNGVNDLFFANIQRVKESIRVIEEFSKLINKKAALEFKKLRYTAYEIEKKIAKKLSS